MAKVVFLKKRDSRLKMAWGSRLKTAWGSRLKTKNNQFGFVHQYCERASVLAFAIFAKFPGKICAGNACGDRISRAPGREKVS